MLIAVIVVILALLVMILLFMYAGIKKELNALQQLHEELLYNHRGMMIKHGMSFEQLFPFMNSYPYNPRNFRFIGTPIDGISFEDDKVVFIEFKTGKSTLSALQQKINDFILRKKVEWKEIREQ